MKLQTSGVLGTSYAFAKLAPKRELGGNRAFIPDDEPQGFVESHLIKNFEWIFKKLTKNEKGYVLPRK